MYVNSLILLSFLCLNICLAPLLPGSARRGPLSPKEATQAMLALMPNETGFLTKLKTLVNAGADVRAKDRFNMTVLHRVALWGGSSAAAQFLTDNSGHTALTNNLRDMPLFLAIYSDNVEVVRILAEEGDDLNVVDHHGMTPLLYALEYDSHKVAKSLIARGASLNVTNRGGLAPLHLVTDKGLAELILEKGGNPNALSKNGMTPLHFAVGHDNRAVTKLLLDAGSNPNARGGQSGMTPLHHAKSAEVAEIVIKSGGDPNASNYMGMTPVHTIGDAKIVKIFAERGGNLNATDKKGNTPLTYARQPLDFKRVEALVLFGADPHLIPVGKTSAEGQASSNRADQQTQQDKKNRDSQAKTYTTTKSAEQPDFLTNLNELARDTERNPMIGRQQELAQVTNALRRKGMKGTVLVGDAGVGKTAMVEGLAYLLANDELPELAGREIFSLDVGSMWGHQENKYVGQLHTRVNNALKFIAAEPDQRILFIDEIHQLLGGGQVSESGSPPITDILKPYLGRGDMQLIGTTTHDEYQRIIEGDRAIVDRLLRIDIDEPSAEETLTILRGIKADYEEHHDIVIADTALQAVVGLSNRYMASQHQPRKAITLLDEASAAMPHEARRLSKKHIATIVAEKIGIPVATILKSKNEKVAELLPALQQQIYGQDRALTEVSSSLAIAFADLVDETRPLAAVLLAGPTGVGKTETAKVMAQHLFDREDNLITADMSGYKHPTSVVALTELLTRAVKAKPHSVILLDEIEKAHPEVQHLLLQLLDEGRLTDSRQRQVDFTNTIIVLTTNSKRVERDFVPELLNRFDKIITYRKLDNRVSLRLVQKQLDELNRGLREKKITISLSDTAQQIIAATGYSQEYGARAMARVFAQLVKYPLAHGINHGVVTSGKNYSIDLQRTGNTRMKASLTIDDELLLEVPVSTREQALDKKNENRSIM